MAQKKPPPPVPPEEENLPLAVLRTHWQKIFFVSAAVILLVWGVAVVGDGIVNYGRRSVTAQAEFAEIPVSVFAEVSFVREERVIPGDSGGIVVVLAEPGGHVGAGQPLATVCASLRDAEALSKEAALEQRLRWLTEAGDAAHYHALNAEQLSRQVDETFADFLRALDRGAVSKMSEPQEAFLQRATALEATMGLQMDFAGEIAEAKAQLEMLRQQSPEGRQRPLPAPAAGDYYPVADGLEHTFAPTVLKDISVESYKALLEHVARPEEREGLGKLVTDFRWYAVTVVPLGDAQRLQEGGRYVVEFPLESARKFPMRVERIRRGGGEEAVVVLSCNEKDDTIHCLRNAKAEIITGTAEGLRIPAAALRFLEKGEGVRKRPFTGVYITRAGKLHLREVEVVHQDADIAVVAWGNLKEAQAVEGERFTVEGNILSVLEPSEGRLLVLGQDLLLKGEALNVKPAIEGGPTTVVTAQRRLFDETIIAGKHLQAQREGNKLVFTGENISFREQRGPGLKIHDTVLVEGRIGKDDPVTIQDSP